MSTVKNVQKWADKIGRNEAHILLIRAGVSPSLAYKLILGTYRSEPGKLVKNAIREAMKRDRGAVA